MFLGAIVFGVRLERRRYHALTEVLKVGAESADVTTVQHSRSGVLVHRDCETLSFVFKGGIEEV